uniref:Serpentine receptor class gamma n=1 Tax=Strongyloides papillosus TaxID=174720 RepID=A0A0N5BYP8_STREA
MAGKVSVFDIIQHIYKIPSMLLMILSVYVLIKKIKDISANFNKQFYTIIVCKLSNEIAYMVTILIFFKLPKWGFYNNFLVNSNWMATTFYVLMEQQTTFMFLITFLISTNRYIAVKYPLLYKDYFSKSKIIIILLTFIISSTIIGLGNIPFNSEYRKFDLHGYFVPFFTSKNVIYYQFFYQVFFYGIISIATCIFNVRAIIALKKHNKNVNKFRKELYYIIYSIFIFITISIVETYFASTIIGLGNIPFNAEYRKFDLHGYFVPFFTSKNH